MANKNLLHTAINRLLRLLAHERHRSEVIGGAPFYAFIELHLASQGYPLPFAAR